jgi:hypothetical protein
MKVRFWVVAAKQRSLRGSLNKDLDVDWSRDGEKAYYPVKLVKQKKEGRPEGWSWVRSRYEGKGAVRYRWNTQLKILECWAVTKGGNRPFQIIGEFVETVLNSQKHKVKSIHVEVG